MNRNVLLAAGLIVFVSLGCYFMMRDEGQSSRSATSTANSSSGVEDLVADGLASAEAVAVASAGVTAAMRETGVVLDEDSMLIISDMSAKTAMAIAKAGEFAAAGDIDSTVSSLLLIADIVAGSTEYIYGKIKASPTFETIQSLSDVIGFVGSAVAAMAVKEVVENPTVVNFLIVYGGDIIIDVTNAVLLAASATGVVDIAAAEQASVAARSVYTAASAADYSAATTAAEAAGIIAVGGAEATSPLIKSATMPANAATAAGTAKGVLAGASMASLVTQYSYSA